jgi:hypothetical protein
MRKVLYVSVHLSSRLKKTYFYLSIWRMITDRSRPPQLCGCSPGGPSRAQPALALTVYTICIVVCADIDRVLQAGPTGHAQLGSGFKQGTTSHLFQKSTAVSLQNHVGSLRSGIPANAPSPLTSHSVDVERKARDAGWACESQGA